MGFRALTSLRNKFFKVFARQHTRVLVRTRGRPSRPLGPLLPRKTFLLLETRGRRSGRPHRVALLYMPEGCNFVVVGSNFGQEQPPAWCRNLQGDSRATVHVNGRSIPVRAIELNGSERDAALADAASYDGQWRRYTQTVQRRLPVVRLEPIDQVSPIATLRRVQ